MVCSGVGIIYIVRIYWLNSFGVFKQTLQSPALFQRMENVATYSEARSEYTKQLATFIVPSIVGWFQTLWARNANDRQRCLSAFQNECEEIARWNQDRINDEVRVLLERSGCDYMEELMTAVFVAHTKVLTAVRLSSKQKKLSITVPKLDHFIHRIFKESARCFWKTPFLFMADGGVVERQKNILQVEALTSEAITTAIRGLLPVKQILQDYLGEDEVEEKEEEEVKAEVVKAEVAEPVLEKVKPKIIVSEEVKTVEDKPSAETTVEKEENEDKEITQVKEEIQVQEEAKEAKVPSVIKIDTEQAVHFSDYDAVFDEAKGAPEMRFNLKDGEGEYDDDLISSDALTIHDGPDTPITADDAEDLDAPNKAEEEVKAKAKPVVKKDVIDDSEVVILE